MSTVREAELMVMPAGRELANRDGEWSVAQIIDQKRKVVQIMQAVMIEGEHYGVIPGAPRRKGINGEDLPPKKNLFKPGAETLCLTFRLDPEYEVLKSVETPELISFSILDHSGLGASKMTLSCGVIDLIASFLACSVAFSNLSLKALAKTAAAWSARRFLNQATSSSGATAIGVSWFCQV